MRKVLIAKQKQNCYMISISTKIDGEIGKGSFTNYVYKRRGLVT